MGGAGCRAAPRAPGPHGRPPRLPADRRGAARAPGRRRRVRTPLPPAPRGPVTRRIRSRGTLETVRRMWMRALPAAPVLAGLLLAAGMPGGAEALLPTGTFTIAPGDSTVTFFVPDNRGGFTGHTTRVTAQIDARAITTDNGLRDGAMRAVYLRTAEWPAITFNGTVTARPGLGVRPFPATVRGRLTIRDVTREQEFSATIVALAHEYLADASTSVRMADYGIPYPRAFIFVARDPVTVKLHLRARQP